jgi:peptidoglycan/xylan/chitin deacetylase (PgdA/CDA1 family)
VDHLIGFFEWLRANDWTAISIDDIEAARRGEKRLPKRAILITFDDGWRSLYTRVFPLVLAYRIPIVAALVGRWVDAPMDAKVPYDQRGEAAGSFH